MADKKVPLKVKFPLRPTIYCPECNALLEYVKAPSRGEVRHPDRLNGCPYTGKTFRGPAIYLEEV